MQKPIIVSVHHPATINRNIRRDKMDELYADNCEGKSSRIDTRFSSGRVAFGLIMSKIVKCP